MNTPIENSIKISWSISEIGAIVFILALTIAMFGYPVPFSDEGGYLVEAYRIYHPGFLKNDWAFSEPWYEHFTFHSLIGLFMIPFGLEAVGWAGRIIAWYIIVAAIVRIAKALRLSLPLAMLSTSIWMAAGQSIVGDSLVLSTFTPSTLAYAFALTGVANLCDGSRNRAVIWIGFSFSIHPAVGMPFLLSFGISTLIIHRRDWKLVLRWAGFGSLAVMPGLISIWLMSNHSQQTGHELWAEIAKFDIPNYIDLGSFEKRRLAFLILTVFACAVLLRSGLYCGLVGETIACTLGGGLVVFLFGIIATGINAWQWLEVTPFRVLPTIAPLFFLMLFFGALKNLASISQFTVLISLITMACFGNPLSGVWDQSVGNMHEWKTYRTDALRETLRWVSQESAPEAVLVVPPNFKEAYWFGKRAIVALTAIPRYDRYLEYRERTELIGGPRTADNLGKKWETNVYSHFNALSLDSLQTLRSRYGASLLISESIYELPILYAKGSYCVYDLSAIGQ